MMLVAVLLLSSVLPSPGSRLTSREGAIGPNDFDFMTRDFAYVGSKKGYFSDMFGSRSKGEEKDEIVKGHFCAARGGRDETYYTSSFCYWLPEFSAPGPARVGGSVVWKGGPSSSGSDLCRQPMAESGKCVKCSVCHNNARAKNGKVQSSAFLEGLELPPCLKEREIDQKCAAFFHEQHPPLAQEFARCEEVRGRWEDAEAALRVRRDAAEALTNKVKDELPQKIRKAEDALAAAQQQLQALEAAEWSSRMSTSPECQPYYSSHLARVHDESLNPEVSTDRLIDDLSCVNPARVEGASSPEMDHYRDCVRCNLARSGLRTQRTKTQNAEHDVHHRMSELKRWKADLQATEFNLQNLESELYNFGMSAHMTQQDWQSQEASCQQTFTSYKNRRNQYVMSCAPTFYEHSCEKACLELQSGCAVVEGLASGEVKGLGGMALQCRPPQPSWVMAPFTYGVREDEAAQCGRIQRHQVPMYTQKAGWLWRGGYVKGWAQRYFMLESGNAVRSAVLRYFLEDPMQQSQPKEQYDTAVTLWDAKGVAARSAGYFGFQEADAECFQLSHFYRDYTFCVSECATCGRTKKQLPAIRDKWVKLVEEALVFKGIVKASPYSNDSRCCCKSSDPSSCMLLSGVELEKSMNAFKDHPVCPKGDGYQHYKKKGIWKLPPACAA